MMTLLHSPKHFQVLVRLEEICVFIDTSSFNRSLLSTCPDSPCNKILQHTVLLGMTISPTTHCIKSFILLFALNLTPPRQLMAAVMGETVSI